MIIQVCIMQRHLLADDKIAKFRYPETDGILAKVRARAAVRERAIATRFRVWGLE